MVSVKFSADGESNTRVVTCRRVSFPSVIPPSYAATPTRQSPEGFITPWKAFEYLTWVWLLASKSARSNNIKSLTFYCVNISNLSLRCTRRVMGADRRWPVFVLSCVQAGQTDKLSQSTASILWHHHHHHHGYHSVRRETQRRLLAALFRFPQTNSWVSVQCPHDQGPEVRSCLATDVWMC